MQEGGGSPLIPPPPPPSPTELITVYGFDEEQKAIVLEGLRLAVADISGVYGPAELPVPLEVRHAEPDFWFDPLTPCFDPRKYGMGETEYQGLIAQGLRCVWGFAAVWGWPLGIVMTPHRLPDGAVNLTHLLDLSRHEAWHVAAFWSHGTKICPNGLGQVYFAVGHGGPCDPFSRKQEP